MILSVRKGQLPDFPAAAFFFMAVLQLF